MDFLLLVKIWQKTLEKPYALITVGNLLFKQAATNELKIVSKLAIKKRAKATGDLIGK